MLDNTLWNKDLISRYNLTGPRYTSYPTALQFSSINSFLMVDALQQCASQNTPLSLYIHIPFCATLCYYCACNKIITKDKSKASIYLQCLFTEIEIISSYINKQQVVEQLHFGGGTPTFLSDEQFLALMDKIAQHFSLTNSDKRDYSIEVDPRAVNVESIGLLAELGFNRLSIGVQDLNPNVQKAVHRIQPLSITENILQAARVNGFSSINLDLIYGLPQQTVHSFSHTLETVVEKLSPDRLSIFNYAHLPDRFASQRRILENSLPSADTKLNILENSIKYLTAYGYRYVGMDHFAKPDDELSVAQQNGGLHRNFQGYTTHGSCDLIGLGISSISKIGNLYAQNSTNLDIYQENLYARQLATNRGVLINEDDRIRAFVIKELMCFFVLDFNVVSKQFNIDAKQYFSDVFQSLKSMNDDGLLEFDGDKIVINLAGRLLVRSVAMLFDKYSNAQQGRFSKII